MDKHVQARGTACKKALMWGGGQQMNTSDASLTSGMGELKVFVFVLTAMGWGT